MKLTQTLKLKKPDYEDVADIVQINENMDIIDQEISKKATSTEIELKLNEKAPTDHVHTEYLRKTARTQDVETLEALIDKKATIGSVYSKQDIDRMLRELKAQGITAEQIAQLITAQQILQKLKTVHGPGSGLEADTVRWNGITGKPSLFPPSTHTHDYLPRMAKAADSELLDGHDSTYFATATRVEQLFQLSADAKQAHIGGINQVINYNSGLTISNSWQDILWWWQNKACIDYAINRLQIRKIIATIAKGPDGFAYQSTPFSKVLFMAYNAPSPGSGWGSIMSAASVWGLNLIIRMIGKNYGESAGLIQIDGGRMKFTNLSSDQVTLEFYLIGFN